MINSRRFSVVIGLAILAAASAASGAAWPGGGAAPRCRILDDTTSPLYRFRLGYTPDSRFEERGKSPMLELDAEWEIAYFRDVLWGDLDVRTRLDTLQFLGSADIALPDLLMVLALETGWTYRSGDAWGLRTRLMPGLYNDLKSFDGGAFAVPFSMEYIHAFNPDLSGVIGAAFRPGFERTVMPCVGVVLGVGDVLRIDARLPEGRLEWFFARDWSAHLGFRWRNLTYDLDDAHEAITVEDFEFGGGLTVRASDQTAFTAELGTRFGRSVEYDTTAPKEPVEYDVEDAVFLRVGLVGPF
jgi:hypothetical protein